MSKLATNLKELREDRELTQEQLARALGFKSAIPVSLWESGKRVPGLDNLIALARFFGVTLDDLVGMEG